MAKTYEPIATQTLGSAAATVTFSSISGAYTDLVLITQPKSVSTTSLYLQLNGDTATNYSITVLYGDGTSAASLRRTSQNQIRLTNGNAIAANFNLNAITQFLNYSNTTTYKTALIRSNDASTGVDATVSLWRSTAAITSIVIYCASGNLDTGSTFTLYGIKAAV